MNAIWIAVVLDSRAVSPHPNYSKDPVGTTTAGQVAATVIGGAWARAAQRVRGHDVDTPLLEEVSGTFVASRLDESAEALLRRVETGRVESASQAAALTVIAVSALTERDRYTDSFRALELAMQIADEEATAEAKLAKVLLATQYVLRLRDYGREYIAVASRAARLLSEVQESLDQIPQFPTSMAYRTSYQEVLLRIVKSLRASLASHFGFGANDARAAAGLPSRLELIAESDPRPLSEYFSSTSSEYSRAIESAYKDRFGSRSVTFGAISPDLFHPLLRLELSGHALVYEARKDLAVFRLVMAPRDDVDVADALRLLRHAGADPDLALALRRFREEGPLAELGRDARSILVNRAEASSMRVVEVRVLGAAADVLSASEASTALDFVLASLSANGPADVPIAAKVDVLRREIGWAAALSLAIVCGRSTEVAGRLLREFQSVELGDALVDQSLGRVASQLEASRLDPSVADSFRRLIASGEGLGSSIRSGLESAFGESLVQPARRGLLDEAIMFANKTLRGDSLGSGVGRVSPYLESELERIQQEAHDGVFARGGPDIGELAALLAFAPGNGSLRDRLFEFLVDTVIPRSYKARALERLGNRVQGGELSVKLLRGPRWISVLDTVVGDAFLDGISIEPFPEGLRFLAVTGVLPSEEVLRVLREWAASDSGSAREEAALSAPFVHDVDPIELISLLLVLSSDRDPRVRGRAGVALLGMRASAQSLIAAMDRRVDELLQEDGLLVPIQLCYALESSSSASVYRDRLRSLAAEHVAFRVREVAERALVRE
ncbi:hypothetical protein RDI86_04185 [Cellulosimicrobium sp. XJ-DQ-B-000]|uniref:hypothetical protein n=1 Tax=Cellulosimicrobium sp. XJ-DQ-B-000 TaxID=3072182 RepID=UPI002806B939|nr:hypothetical protein [Cellulosimicrobium sp. XJ-DQ-B-000]MDQ8041047.1 hypothetical protein [Cellulosimicrobium sp. XJ-DQ-B-000]